MCETQFMLNALKRRRLDIGTFRVRGWGWRQPRAQKNPLDGRAVPLTAKSPIARALYTVGLCDASVRALRQWRSRLWTCLVAEAPPTSNSRAAIRGVSSSTTTFALAARSDATRQGD